MKKKRIEPKGTLDIIFRDINLEPLFQIRDKPEKALKEWIKFKKIKL